VVKGLVEDRAADRIKKVASTEGLGSDISYYQFYPPRKRAAGIRREKGLEYLDYEERIIHRLSPWRPHRRWHGTRPMAHFFISTDGISMVRVKMLRGEDQDRCDLGPACRMRRRSQHDRSGMDVAVSTPPCHHELMVRR